MTLVSCVVSTGDRPEFLRQLLRCFARQTYKSKELIVVDGGVTPAAASCANARDVHYLRVPADLPLGERLNRGIAASRGRIVQKLDDDDFYHREFLARAVTALVRAGEPQTSVVAWDCFHVLLRGDPQVRFSGHGWAAGGTFCFARELWRRVPFRGPRSVDHQFLHDSAATLLRVCAPRLYLYVRHGKNIWSRTGSGTSVDHMFRTRRPATARLRDLVEPEDRRFYEGLAGTRSSRS
jgi:glycosyltransferase involved in cell wall biosynthesis